MLRQDEDRRQAPSGELRVPLNQKRPRTACSSKFLRERPARRARLLEQSPELTRPFSSIIGGAIGLGQLGRQSLQPLALGVGLRPG